MAVTRRESIVARPRSQQHWERGHLGASQGDIAALKGEDVDWANNTVGFFRKKTGVPVLVHLGSEANGYDGACAASN